MSCPHPEQARQTRTTSLNPSAKQTEEACGLCGAVLSVETEEVRV
jgi:hypothetical protein